MDVKTIEKAEDIWSKYKLGTRIVLMIALILYAIVILVGVFAEPYVIINEKVMPNKIFMYDILIDSTSKVVLIGFVFVTLGSNVVLEIAKLYIKFKAGGKQNNTIEDITK